MVHLYHPHRQAKLSPSTYSGCCTSSCCSRCVQRALSEACAAIIPDCRLAYVRIYLAPCMAPLARFRSLLQSSLLRAFPTRLDAWIQHKKNCVGKHSRYRMEHHVTCLVNVAVYGPIVDQLVVTGLPIPSWTGFNPALVPNRAPSLGGHLPRSCR